jgi:Bacteriophage tail sheath protein
MPSSLTYPGVYIEELPSAVRTITGVPTSITAFVGRAWMGPVDEPTRVNSYADFERIFGGLWRSSALSYAVQQFFANGGSQALIVRVANRTDGASVIATTAKFALNPGTKLEAANPGTWGNNLVLSVNANVSPDPPADAGRFNLVVFDDPERKEDARKIGGSGARETFLNVSVTPASPRYVLRVLAEQSKLVRVQDNVAGSVGNSPPSANAAIVATGVANLGRDGTDITSADVKGVAGSKTGIYALNKADTFNLLCLPPVTLAADQDNALWNDAATLCKERRAMLLVDAPRSWEVASAATNVVAAPFGNIAARSYAAVYFPRLRLPDPLMENKLEDFAPSGAVAGVISRTDGGRGVWKAPAGIDAALGGVFEFSINGNRANLNDAENGTLNPLGLNCLRSLPGIGPVVWGARTMDGRDVLASQWKYLPVRRLALYIEESLYRGTQWVVFEPNDEPLWAQIRLNIGAFMHGLFRQGAFQGTTPREAYLVKCDRETTTQDDINRGVVNILVGFAPLKPAEFVVIKIQQLAGQIQT